jgi:hypothetical protein
VGHSVDWLQAACRVKDFLFIGLVFWGANITWRDPSSGRRFRLPNVCRGETKPVHVYTCQMHRGATGARIQDTELWLRYFVHILHQTYLTRDFSFSGIIQKTTRAHHAARFVSCLKTMYILGVKVKVKAALSGPFDTDAYWHIVSLTPDWVHSFISRGAAYQAGMSALCQRMSELYRNLASKSVIFWRIRLFYMPQNWDMGQIILLPLRRKASRGFYQ